MEDMKDVVRDYVTKEYLEDDSEPIDNDTPLISGGIVDSFSMVSLKTVPGEQVPDPDPRRQGDARGVRFGQQDRDARRAIRRQEVLRESRGQGANSPEFGTCPR